MGLFGRKKADAARIRDGYLSLPRTEWTDAEFDLWFDSLGEDGQWAEWEAWSLETVEHPIIKSIRSGALDMGLEAAKASYPQEFGCMLRVIKGVITELVLVPGTIQGDRHAIFQFGNLPVDRSIQGTLHSHPSPHPYPSDADFALFEQHGSIHLILGHPFGPDDWRAYDHTGTPTFLEVIEEGGAGEPESDPGFEPLPGDDDLETTDDEVTDPDDPNDPDVKEARRLMEG